MRRAVKLSAVTDPVTGSTKHVLSAPMSAEQHLEKARAERESRKRAREQALAEDAEDDDAPAAQQQRTA